MIMRQMELFVLAVETGSLSKAAAHELLSVAAVSQQIKALEKEIGSPLLKRTNHGTLLTEQGTQFYYDAKSILSQTRQAIQRAKERANDIRKLVIGGYGSDSHQILPEIVLSIMNQYPQTNVSVRPISYDVIEEELLSFNIDMCFVYGQNEVTIHSPLLCYKEVFMDSLKLSVPIDGVLSDMESVSLEELRGTDLVIIKKGFSSVHDRIREYIEFHEPSIRVSDCTESFVENACRLHTTKCSYMVPSLFDLPDPTRILKPFKFMNSIPIGVIYRKASNTFIERHIIPLSRRVFQEMLKKNG